RAAITGDFVLIASEVNPVIRALRENGIQVTALHSHMLGEDPRLYFMHFWANDDAVKLAHGLGAALDKTNSKKGAKRRHANIRVGEKNDGSGLAGAVLWLLPPPRHHGFRRTYSARGVYA